jgi:hypothetical protein
MTRLAIATVICVGCLIFGAGDCSAKKKRERPVQEHFEATISPVPMSVSGDRVAIAIEGFTSEQELQDLARTFLSGGKRTLRGAMGKMRKGYLDVPGGRDRMPIETLESNWSGAVRNLTIVAERGLEYWGISYTDRLDVDYPYTCVQLGVDEQGNGKGTIIRFAKVTFNAQGRMVIENWSRQPLRLINVHLVK